MTLPGWLAQVRQATDIIDQQYGETVRLLPWTKSDFTEAGPDLTRPVKECTAIFKTTRAMPANVSPQLASRFAQSDAYIALNEEHVLSCDLQEKDRVELLTSRQGDNVTGMYEVVYVSPTPFKRSRVFLIRKSQV